MKKNFAMRIAACLLMVTMLSLCMVSYTYAKYTTTSKKAEDTAKVAKWGIVMTVTGDELVYDDDKTTKDATAKVLKNSLAAPGTYEKLTTFTLNGTPEVAYEIEVIVNLELTNWTVAGSDYCPLIFSVDGVEYFIGKDATITDVASLESAVKTAIIAAIAGPDTDTDANKEKYAAGTAVPSTANEVLIDWKWEFEKNTVPSQDNAKDTVLGDAYNANISFDLQVIVTQVD